MSGRLLDADPITRQRVDWHDQSDGGVIVDTRQDVEPVIEANKRLKNDHDGSLKGDMHLAGRIPLAIYEKLVREGRARNGNDLLKWLEDPANAVWKIHPGKLSR